MSIICYVRPETIARAGYLGKQDLHGREHGPPAEERQSKRRESAAPRNLRSNVRQTARAEGLTLLSKSLGSFRPMIPAVIDAQRSHVDEMLSGVRPWPIEAFVLVAKRAPSLAVEVVLAYCSLLSQSRREEIALRLNGSVAIP